MSGRTLDLLALGLAGGEYVLNRLWLRRVTSGWLRDFVVCWANDIFAGLFMAAWLNLLLGFGTLGRVRSWKGIVPSLFACSLLWELAAPLVKPGAVFDLWDFAAYQMGGLLYLMMEQIRIKQLRRNDYELSLL